MRTVLSFPPPVTWLGHCPGTGCRQWREGLRPVPRLPSDRPHRQERGRPHPQRPHRSQGRHGRGLQLLARQQELRHHLGRGHLHRIHQGSQSQGAGHQDDLRRAEGRAADQGPARLPQAIRRLGAEVRGAHEASSARGPMRRGGAPGRPVTPYGEPRTIVVGPIRAGHLRDFPELGRCRCRSMLPAETNPSRVEV